MAKDKFITHSFPDVLCWIENNIHRGIKSTDVVAITGYSRSYFLREFQLAIGVSLSQYIREQRLRISASKLTWTNLKVREISEEWDSRVKAHFVRHLKHTSIYPQVNIVITQNFYKSNKQRVGTTEYI